MLSLASRESNPEFRVENATMFLQRDSDVDVRGFGQWKATQNCVAVSASSTDPDVGEISTVPQIKLVSTRIDLAVLIGTFRVLIDLLQEHDVGLIVGNDGDDSARVVAPVDAADAFMDVVSEKFEFHVMLSYFSWHYAPGFVRKKQPAKQIMIVVDPLTRNLLVERTLRSRA